MEEAFKAEGRGEGALVKEEDRGIRGENEVKITRSGGGEGLRSKERKFDERDCMREMQDTILAGVGIPFGWGQDSWRMTLKLCSGEGTLLSNS